VQSWNAIAGGWLDPELNWRLAPKPKQCIPPGYHSRSVEDLNRIPSRVLNNAVRDLFINSVDIEGDVKRLPALMCAQRALNGRVRINVRLAIRHRQVTTIGAATLRVPVSGPLNPQESVVPSVQGECDHSNDKNGDPSPYHPKHTESDTRTASTVPGNTAIADECQQI
jgi:hypothetical protein